MTAARAAIAVHAISRGTVMLQSDCIRAYTQAEMKGNKTFIRLPRPWWPKIWHKMGLRDPVVELRKALYGHPQAGDLWHNHLKTELETLGFATIDGWPSTYVRGAGSDDMVLIIVYVDDLLIVGKPDAIERVTTKLRQRVKMEDPEPMDKYLGCYHHMSRGKDGVLDVRFDMTGYLPAAVDIYIAETGLKVTTASSPYPPELPPAQLQHALESPGRFQHKAASLLMKLMYAARMAVPSLCVAVQRLASNITK